VSEPATARFRIIAVAIFALAILVRLHNVYVFPMMRSPDAFGHFTYIWYLAATGHIPLATEGWSFFHPPLYYAFMTVFWKVFAALDPVSRLTIGTAAIAMMGLVHAVVVFLFTRRRFPHDRVVQLCATAFVLFLPVQLYSAGYIGNEALNAVLCSLSLLALVRLLERPVWQRAAVLGLSLGLGMLTKFTSLSVVAGTLAVIALHALYTREWLRGAKLLTVAGAMLVMVCGWFYARNVVLYGNPFQMSRDTLAVRRVENLQTQGVRGLYEYILFDPMIVLSPQWPRGIPLQLVGNSAPPSAHDALRESVWTGMFANTFFDAVGGQVLPTITQDLGVLRAGRILLALGLIPTFLILIGITLTIARMLRRQWSDVDVAVLFPFLAAMALFAYGAKSVPMHAAIKATYLSAATAMFGYWFACGLALVRRLEPRTGAVVVGVSALLAVASVTVFTLGRVVGRGYLAETPHAPVFQNIYGIIEYAGGNRDKARRLFDLSASNGWHLGMENLAAIALEEGRPLEAIYRLRRAADWQRTQSFGVPEDKARFDRITQAEYSNSMAVIYYRLGWNDAARAAAEEAVALDASIPEAIYDRGVVELTDSQRTRDSGARMNLIEQARSDFERATALDPAFRDAQSMRMVAGALAGKCPAGATADLDHGPSRRIYPIETGTGDWHASALHRRRHIEDVPERLRPQSALAACDAKRG